jgi:perosamine synthetase
LFRTVIDEEAIAKAAETIRSGWVAPGPRTREFEQAFARFIDVPHCVAVASGTEAVHLGLRLLDLPPGAEVVTTPVTFVATNHSILYEGGRPVFADIQRETGNLDPSSVAAKITEHTKAIVIVHYGGYPCDIDELYALAADHGLPIVEDCAHACGASYKGKKIGSHGAIHAFSFSPAKNLATPGGGAITLQDGDHAERLRRVRNLGVSQDSLRRAETKGTWDYDVTEVGFRASMNDVSAAIALVQLEKLDVANARRAEITALYEERLKKVPGVGLLNLRGDRETNNYLFSVLVEERDALVEKLKRADIESAVHFRRNDLFRMYDEQELPNTEWFWRRQLSLPIHLALSDEEVQRVCDTIESGW